MNKDKQTIFLSFGGGSLLATFGILCLVVLAMLSITTVQSDRRQAESSYQSVSDFYAADRMAQNIFARLKLGETVDGVQIDGDIYRYICPISDTQYLEVELQKTDDGWEVLRWQSISTMEYQEETLPVWGTASP
jgi:hypothetical protein